MFLKRCFKPLNWVTVCLSALGALALNAGQGRAQLPMDDLYHDLWQTVQARKLLLEDPQLGPLNVGVKVANRVAILWGPVPSQELAFRAEQRLRIMFELIEIRNRLTIEPEDNDWPARPLAPPMPRFLPDAVPPVPADGPRRPALLSNQRVELAGIDTSPETTTARSSPLDGSNSPQAPAGPATLHLPFLGSIALPR